MIDPRMKKFAFAEKLTYQPSNKSESHYVLYASPYFHNGSLMAHYVFCPKDGHYYYISIKTGSRNKLKRGWVETSWKAS